jgi:hypothetical protein
MRGGEYECIEDFGSNVRRETIKETYTQVGG